MTALKPAPEEALMLAALCGFKIALGPAFLAASKRAPATKGWAAAAIGEMALDKLGVFPARYRPMLLVPHTVAGAMTAAQSLKEDGEEVDPSVVAAAAVVAAGVTATLPLVRIALSKVVGFPDIFLGLAEDYVALQLGTKAVGMSMDQVKAVARESVEGLTERARPQLDELAERFRPTLQKVGVNV